MNNVVEPRRFALASRLLTPSVASSMQRTNIFSHRIENQINLLGPDEMVASAKKIQYSSASKYYVVRAERRWHAFQVCQCCKHTHRDPRRCVPTTLTQNCRLLSFTLSSRPIDNVCGGLGHGGSPRPEEMPWILQVSEHLSRGFDCEGISATLPEFSICRCEDKSQF